MNKAKQQPTFSWSNFLELRSPVLELFLGELKEAYWAENHLVRVLLKMTNATTSSDLHLQLNHQLEGTKLHHISKLEHIFELLDETIDARRNCAVAGLSTDADEMIEYTDDGTDTRDLGIILICQKIVQYKIATYSALINIATAIGREDLVTVLNEILFEETERLEALSTLSASVTIKAVEEN